jgi:hypothetical protein
MQLAWKFGLIALVALALTVAPGGGSALNLALTVLSILFFTAIAMLGYRLYREHGFELDSLSSKQRLVLYGSIGLALLTFTATNRLFDQGGVGVLVWLALLAACSYGVFWVWTQYRQYQ